MDINMNGLWIRIMISGFILTLALLEPPLKSSFELLYKKSLPNA